MKKEQLLHYKQLILEKRNALLRELDYLRDSGLNSAPKDQSGEHSTYTYHMADQGTDTMYREQQYLFAAREGNYLYHLDLALERIEQGEYGICVRCGKEISPERLEAVPHVRLCIICKSKEELLKR